MKSCRLFCNQLLAFGIEMNAQLSRQVGAAAGDVALPLLAAAVELPRGRPGTPPI